MKTKGFTIIELMIAVAIIGILAAIAIPSYQIYITRSKTTEAIEMLAPYQTGIYECAQNNGGETLNGCNAGTSGIPALQTGKYGNISQVTDGVIQFEFTSAAGEQLSGGYVKFLPSINSTKNVIWRCVIDGVKVTTNIPPSSFACADH